MIENLSQYWDKADGKTKKKILGRIFKEKFEDFNFERCNHIFTPEIESIMLASKVLQKNKNKKEVKNGETSKVRIFLATSKDKKMKLTYSIMSKRPRRELLNP